MIDPATRQQFDRAVRVAVANGRDLGEELDRLGILLTESRRDLIVRSALRSLLVALDAAGASAMMQATHGRTHGSPADMFHAVQRWGEEYLKGR